MQMFSNRREFRRTSSVTMLVIVACAVMAACSGGVGEISQSGESAIEAQTRNDGTSSSASLTTDQTAGVAKEAVVEWQPNADSDVVGYRIYYGSQSQTYQQAKGAGIDAGRVTQHVVKGLQPGAVHYFAVTAYDVVGNESAYSAEVSWIAQ